MTPGEVLPPIVSLDIDGVLNGHEARDFTLEQLVQMPEDEVPDLAKLLIEPELVARLNQITQRSGAAIVVHSSWRYFFSAACIKAILRHVGVEGELLGVVGGRERSGRADAIRAWLYDQGHHKVPLRFVVLDDEILTFEPIIGKRQVGCNFTTGLTDENVEHACRLLAADAV